MSTSNPDGSEARGGAGPECPLPVSFCSRFHAAAGDRCLSPKTIVSLGYIPKKHNEIDAGEPAFEILPVLLPHLSGPPL